MNIMERRKTGIFSMFVFNNLLKFRLSFHPPPFFVTEATAESAKSFNFNGIDFSKIFAIHR